MKGERITKHSKNSKQSKHSKNVKNDVNNVGERLALWQKRFSEDELAYSPNLSDMQRRDEIYRGNPCVSPMFSGEREYNTKHVRNIVCEIIEAEVDPTVPSPKVSAVHEEDEQLAKLIEDMIRSELDRLNFEEINDLAERIVPIQGGAYYLCEWDSTGKAFGENGCLSVSLLHPEQLIPQKNVCSVGDMDYFFIKTYLTPDSIMRRYGVRVDESDYTGATDLDSDSAALEIITAYYKGENSTIGVFAYTGDTVLIDIPDYQAKSYRVCENCGNKIYENLDVCPVCESKKISIKSAQYEQIDPYVRRSDNSRVALVEPTLSDSGRLSSLGLPIYDIIPATAEIPVYKPGVFPVVLQKSVSSYANLLGDSDVDKIADQQNTVNRLENKIIDKLMSSGSYITLPSDAKIKVNSQDMKIIYPHSVADKSMIDVYDMQGNISADMAYMAQVYEEARQQIGITDSYLGREDRTATSGVAKEFAANQSQGRLESKRVMKDSAYARLFELIFKFKLAYSNSPISVISYDETGNRVYKEFNRYDFLKVNEDGEYVWNDNFIFSCDRTAPLTSNREAMWQETRLNLQTGAFGDPSDIETLILFWGKMELLHYPGAGETKRYLISRRDNNVSDDTASLISSSISSKMKE